ncbi:Dabb family protein [Microbacteriaceae bacterium VKM Ac-2854]|nr:Dabb family protein [Microbacteriaceae bacterium VKM Ac-2854]
MSIRHIVAWRLNATDPDTKREHARQIAERLLALKGVVPEIEAIEVGGNIADPERNWDVALVSQYADLEALARYQVHPEHLKVAAFVGTLVSERASVDFEI